MRGYLAIKDVGVFSGRFFGWTGGCSGEIVPFHSHYFCWDILTDPSYHQRIVLTDPLVIENRWPSAEEEVSFEPHLSGLVFLGKIATPKHFNPRFSLESYMTANRVSGFIPDRRELVADALKFARNTTGCLDKSRESAVAGCQVRLSYTEAQLKRISAPGQFLWDLAPGNLPKEKFHVVVWDFGLSYQLLRSLKRLGCRLRVVPPDSHPEDIIALHPDGVIITGGPATPDKIDKAITRIERIIGIRPILGVGNGAILLASALGINTPPLETPHYGCTIPVEELGTGQVLATYQSHSHGVSMAGLRQSGAEITHVNVCDGSVEGFCNREYASFAHLFLADGDSQLSHLRAYLDVLGASTSTGDPTAREIWSS